MTTDALAQEAFLGRTRGLERGERMEQYTLWQILGIWALAALPMGFILWVIMPILVPRLTVHPGLVYYPLIVLGLVWQGVLAYIILRREVKPFTWENIKDRLWLQTPSDPKTGVRSKWLYLWTIPFIAIVQVWYGFEIFGWMNELWVKAFPFLSPPAYGMIWNLAEPAKGQWWLLGILAVAIAFNYLLGEELIFRGILLPKMNGVFRKWDFLANGMLFSMYHLHMIWGLPSMLFVDWIHAFAAKRFKSYWMAVITHGFDALFLIYIFIMAIEGKVL
jgi:membrane protease YdiL (CAAX protease family)